MKRIFEINPWKVITHTFNKEDKRLQESMTSTGNEYMGMRGMFEEKYSGDTHKGIYLGGVWFPDKTRVGWWKNGYPEYFGKVINAVDFVSVDVKLDGESVDLAKDEFSDFELALDMKSGVLTRSYVVKRGEKKVKLNFERFISVDMKELYADRITVENLSSANVEVEIESMIDADVFNEDSNYDEKFWNVLSKKADQTTGRLVAETIKNNFGTPQFTTEMLMANVSDLDAKEPVETDLKVSNVLVGTLEAGKKTVFEKRVVVVTSRDYATLEDLDAALSSVSDQADAIREGMKTAEQRMKELQKLIEYGKNYTEYKPIHDELKKLKNGWTNKRDKYEEAHRAELTLWNAASRYLHANLPKGIKPPLPISEWEKEYATLSGQRTAKYTKLKETRAEVAELHNIRKCVDIALKADQPEQTRAKRHEQER